MTTVRSHVIAIQKELKVLDAKTNSQTILGGPVDQILVVKKKHFFHFLCYIIVINNAFKEMNKIITSVPFPLFKQFLIGSKGKPSCWIQFCHILFFPSIARNSKQ
jgi:hypothetical protein